MPLFTFKCLNGHIKHLFCHSYKDKGCETALCHCGHTMGPIIDLPNPLLWAEEGRARVIHNMGDKPVVVKSHAEHKRIMKERGLEFAGKRRGERGSWE